MRTSVAVASCFGVGLVLQGCGGGEQKDKTTCLAEHMEVVSQSMSGKVEVTVEANANEQVMNESKDSIFMTKIDFEKFNMREDASATVNGTTVNETTIINVDEKHMIVYTVMGEGKENTKDCIIQDLPKELSADALAMQLKLIVIPALHKEAKCGGNDGTLDTWKFSQNYTGPLPNLPDMPDLPIPDLDESQLSIKDGSVSEDVKMSKDSLLHGSTTVVSGELLNGTKKLGSLSATISMTIDDVKKGGPSPAELDPSQFDTKCHKVNTTIDMQAFLRSPGFARQQLLRAMEASKNSEPALMV